MLKHILFQRLVFFALHMSSFDIVFQQLSATNYINYTVWQLNTLHFHLLALCKKSSFWARFKTDTLFCVFPFSPSILMNPNGPNQKHWICPQCAATKKFSLGLFPAFLFHFFRYLIPSPFCSSRVTVTQLTYFCLYNTMCSPSLVLEHPDL